MQSKSTTPIPSFPPEIDRRDFGNWLSGFVDGEGSFILQVVVEKQGGGCRASLRIELRDDDTEILRLIQSYWQCGNLYARLERTRSDRHTNPHSQYVVSGWNTLTTIVIPHFQMFPLRAKKARDFTIWSKAVDFAHSVSLRPRFGIGQKHNKKWYDNDFEVLAHYQQMLEQGRIYS